jgi:hypothetical protein
VSARARALAGAAVLFAGLATLHTWPLATDPAGLSRNDNGDAQLNEWIVAWIAHQLPRAPLHLYDANIFYPEPRTLTFSEPLLVPALVGAPLHWLGASPVLAFNLLLLLGFVTTGLAGYVAGRGLTGDAGAALLLGCLLAFNAQTLSRLPHLQAQWAFGMPLAFLSLERVIAAGRRRDGLLLGLWVALLGLTSGYWGALAGVALAVAFLARAPEWVGRSPRTLLALGGGVALTTLLSVPLLWPYVRASREQGLVRHLDEAAAFSSSPANYLSTPARLHYSSWAKGFYRSQGGSQFPGVVALALAGYALATRGLRDGRARALVLVAAAGLLLSLGPATPAYRLLYELVPPMRALRDPSRFGYLVIFAVALLATEGLRALRARLPPARALALTAGLLVAANAEALVAPVGYVRFDGFSPVYARLASLDRAVVAELPLYPAAEVYRNAAYVLASTAHWKPLVNGYSGFTPPGFVRRAELVRHFPDDAAIAELRRIGVTHVVVHYERYRSERAARIRARLAGDAGFVPLETGPQGETLYRLLPAPPRAQP